MADDPERVNELETQLSALQGTYYFERVKGDKTKWTFVSEAALINMEAKRVRNPRFANDMEEIFNAGQCVFKDGPTLEAFYRFLRRCRTRI